jgi:hypothetical protein
MNMTYINSGNYRRKFDRISNNPELNKKRIIRKQIYITCDKIDFIKLLKSKI